MQLDGDGEEVSSMIQGLDFLVVGQVHGMAGTSSWGQEGGGLVGAGNEIQVVGTGD